jgi:uncharacterized protein (DUF58 family)
MTTMKTQPANPPLPSGDSVGKLDRPAGIEQATNAATTASRRSTAKGMSAPRHRSRLSSNHSKKQEASQSDLQSVRSGRIRVFLTREGLNFGFLTVFVFVGAIIQDVNLLVMLGGVLVGMLVLQWRFCKRTLVKVDAVRNVPRQAYARESFHVSIEIENRKSWLSCWGVTAQMQLTQHATQQPELTADIKRMIQLVCPRKSQTATFELVCNDRGRYEFSPMVLSTRYPLALMISSRRVWKQQTTLVLPAIGKLHGNYRELFAVHPFGSRKKYARGGSSDGEFYGLRDYVSGDSPRIIHWRSSARQNKLVVRQFERQESHQICVLLDLVRDASHDTMSEDEWLDSVDRAVEFLSTIAKQLVGRGRVSLSVVSTAQAPIVARQIQNGNQVNELLAELATIESTSFSDCHAAALELAPDLHTSPRLLVISTRPRAWDENDDTGQLTALSFIKQRVEVRWVNVSQNEESPYFQRHREPNDSQSRFAKEGNK